MAIYHLNTHTIGRAAGHSTVAAAAYRSASRLVDEHTGEVFDFTRKGGVMHAEIVTPYGVPVPERAALWNEAEAAEKRKDARVAREWRAALPHELDEAGWRELATRMGKAIANRYGVAVDVCIHAPDKDGDDRNFHVHMLATTRTIGADGKLGEKASIELSNAKRKALGLTGATADEITEIRAIWADLTNEALERAGISARVDHRSYADQGIELTPTRHIGTDAVAMQRRGLEGVERIDLHNADRQEQARQIAERPEIILDKITATQAVFSRREIAAELNRYIDDAGQFQALLAKLENSPHLVELEPATGRHPAKFSTREVIDTERAMVASAERLVGSGKHGVSTAIVNAAIDGVGTLSDEQKNAVRHVTQAGSLAVVIGDAGTGKSFSMKVAREAWEAAGYNVRGAALAGKAADELQAGSGIESRTLASLEWAWKNGKDRLTSRDVLVIDEAGMIGSRQLGRVLAEAGKAGAKVVLLGDDKQLAAIEAGAAFRGVVQRVGAAEITEVRRQKHAWMREAGQQLARGSVADGLAAYAERGHVKISDSREAAREALAAAYVADQGTGSQIILAHSNKDVQALNEAVREARKERDELAGAARFMTERGGREFAQGDRLVFLRNDRELDVKNGTLGTVEQAEDGRLAVRLDSGEMREFSAGQYAAVDHGYAVTIHKAQGVTVDRAYLLATPGMDRSLAYVGMTRHREAVTLFAGADDFTDRRAGRLVDHGAAPYEHGPENGLSYFAKLENGKGERHTIWGVDLERAIADSGAQIGDRIGLAHGGAQTVRLPDGRMVERNTWHVQTAEELAAGKLAQVMGRQRAKESTLDYLPDFAEQRGFDGESVLRRWVERGRAKVAELAGRMRDALRRGLERHGRPDLMPAADIAGKPAMPQQQPQQVESTPEDEKARKAREIAERFRQKVAQERGELAAPQQRPQAGQQATDALAGFRASVERAEAAGGGLALDVARAQLAVAQEFQAAGKDPRHHAAAIMQEGQRRAFAGLSQPSPAKAERQAERPAAVQVNAVAVGLAKQAVSKFKALAAERRIGTPAMKDRGSKWQSLAPELREQIERFNALPAAQQVQAAERMQQEMAERYSRDPKAAARDRELFQGRDRGGLSR